MAFKESKLYSILNFKCPRCHEGEMFPPNTLYNPSKFSEMYKRCPCCGQNYEPEPGFYYGAMYVSFGISTALFIGVWVALMILTDEVTLTMMILAIVAIAIGLLPINYRLSRSIWINIFVGYEGPCAEIKKKI